MEIKGKVIDVTVREIGVSAKGEWSKFSIVVDNGEKYNNIISVDVFNDKIDTPQVGEIVTLEFNISSREYNGKYYTNLQAWRMDRQISNKPTSINQEPKAINENSDDLPF